MFEFLPSARNIQWAKQSLVISFCLPQVKIMKECDPTGKRGPKNPLPDIVKIIEPKEDEYVADKPYIGKETDVL